LAIATLNIAVRAMSCSLLDELRTAGGVTCGLLQDAEAIHAVRVVHLGRSSVVLCGFVEVDRDALADVLHLAEVDERLRIVRVGLYHMVLPYPLGRNHITSAEISP
jgi:hypothetical protein